MFIRSLILTFYQDVYDCNDKVNGKTCTCHDCEDKMCPIPVTKDSDKYAI